MPRPCFAYSLTCDLLGTGIENDASTGGFIRLSRLIFTGAGLFEAGAILGHAFRDCGEPFVIAYCPNGNEPSKATQIMYNLARRIGESAVRAATLLDLFMADERALQGQSQSGHWSAWLQSLSAERVPITEQVTAFGMMKAVMGAGFGMQCPEQTERLVPATYVVCASDREAWRDGFKYGVVDSPEPAEPKSLAEREQDVKPDFAAFCRQFYPEVLRPLGLEHA